MMVMNVKQVKDEIHDLLIMLMNVFSFAIQLDGE